jgi:Ca2+-binding EF-hand superfamily protein
MARRDFDDWMIKLGVSNPYIRERLFHVFDCDNDRFIDFEEFKEGLKQLVAGKSKVELAFSLFDVDANGTSALPRLL